MSDIPEASRFSYRPHLDYLSTNKRTPFVELYLTSFASACSAEIVAYPFDVCKTRMQLQGEMASRKGEAPKYRGMLATAWGIIREEGPHKLYGGISAMAMRHLFFSGLKMYFYDVFRNALIINDENGKPQLTYVRGCICGVMCGALASIMTTPVELMKVQLQMEGKRRLMGEPPRIHNIGQALTSIYKTGGVRGLWKGTVPSALRSALVTVGDVSFYDLSKRTLMTHLNMNDNLGIQFMGAMIAGFAGAVLSTPADVIKSRIMNQPTDDKGKGLHYKGTIDCFTKLVRDEGFLGMYKGFLPFWLRVGPWTMVFWLTFEQIRRLRGDEAY